MKLLELEILPQGVSGWSSGKLTFGNRVTQLYAPNGSGKTPLVQAIVFCLGYPVKFRDDIYQKCDSAALKIRVGKFELLIVRKFDKDFIVTVYTDNEIENEFYDEKEFSSFMFNHLGLKPTSLVSTQEKQTSPYLSTFLPLVYLDQDLGYSDIYKSTANFIKDQYCEMFRLAVGMPPRNSYDQKKELIDKKDKLETVDRRIVYQKKVIDDAGPIDGEIFRSIEELDAKINILKKELTIIQNSKNFRNDSFSSMDTLLSEKKKELLSLSGTIEDLNLRVDGIEKISSEIELEINTLGLNEEARRLFDSFNDICCTPNCGLFLGSSDAYGKNLLYLKDQIKDLERNSEIAKIRINELEKVKTSQEVLIEDLTIQRDKLLTSDNASGLVETIGKLTKELISLETERNKIENLLAEKEKLSKFSIDRIYIQEAIASLAGSTETESVQLTKLRRDFKEKIIKWLDIIRTINVSRNITIQTNLVPIFGEEKIDQFKGSTKVRVVLAVHAAIMEIFLSSMKNEIKFFILDTPKQHEIQTEDLSSYIDELKKMADKYSAQIIFSSTEYHYDCKNDDTEWRPQFPGKEHNMYLGVQ